jgi:hypothetical protein
MNNFVENSIKINNIVNSMREFQKINNIKNQCMTNTQTLYDILKNNNLCYFNAKAKAVFAISNNKETNTVNIIHHIVIIVNNIIIDPSYDVYSLINIDYYDNIKDFTSLFENPQKQLLNLKEYLTKFIHFTKIAIDINNGELRIANKDFYNKQADYIEKLYS